MSPISERINTRLDYLKSLVENQEHLSDPAKVSGTINSLTVLWKYMTEDQKDYVDAVRWAMSNKYTWHVE